MSTNKILFKRGNQGTLPTLDVGEPGFSKDTKKFYIGSEEGNVHIGSGRVSLVISNESGILPIPTASITIQNEEFDPNTDSFLLHVGGLLQTPGVNYTWDGNVITKVADGTGSAWPTNYVYDITLLRNAVTATDIDTVPITSFEARTTIASDSSTVQINISEYNKDTDVLLVFLNGSKLLNVVDFTIVDDNTISKPAGLWSSGDIFDFTIIKSKHGMSDRYDGRAIDQNSVKLISLDPSIQSVIQNPIVITDELTGDKYTLTAVDGNLFLKVIEAV